MKILFLHGWKSVPGGVKPSFLAQHGHQVFNPALPDEDFEQAVAIAQDEFDRNRPDVVVGSSRGGAVAMNLDTKTTPWVLLCPAWRRWGRAKTVREGSTILHSRSDEVIPFTESEELVRNSGLPASALIEVGSDHRLADPEPLAAMLKACEAAVVGNDDVKMISCVLDYWGDHVATFDPVKVATRLAKAFPEATIDPRNQSEEEVNRIRAFLESRTDTSEEIKKTMLQQIQRKARGNGPVLAFTMPSSISGTVQRYSINFLWNGDIDTQLEQRILSFLSSLKLGSIEIDKGS